MPCLPSRHTTKCFFRFGTSFFTFLIFIFSVKDRSSLGFLCSSLGYSTSAPKIYPFLSVLTSLPIFSGVKLSASSHASPLLVVLDHCPPIKAVLIQILKIYTCLVKTVLLFHILIISIGVAFTCLSNSTLDTFFKYHQHVYVCKQLKHKLGIMGSLYVLLNAHSTKNLSLIRSAILILVLCKIVLDLTYSALCTYFKKFRIHLPTAKHLLLDKRRGNLLR